MQELLATFMQGLQFGEEQRDSALTVLPVHLDNQPAGIEYLTLGEALAAGTLSITEISEVGTVPELAVVNRGELPVLLLDGEELAGARQNRVANTTMLLKERTRTIIPVSCVEQGRWHYDSREFSESGNMMTARLRASKGRSVSESLRRDGQRNSNQGEVWTQVEEMASSAHSTSPTGAMRDVYAHMEHDLQASMRFFTPLPGQRGLAAFIDGRLAGIEYLSQPRAFAKVFDKLLRSYALDALQRGGEGGPADEAAVRQCLAALAASSITTYPALGYGDEHRFSATGMQGSALIHAGTLIHLTLLADMPRHPGHHHRSEESVPFPRSYWVHPGRLLAGCYPGAPGSEEMEEKLEQLLAAGIGTVINLMEEDEHDRFGRRFVPYEERLVRLAEGRGEIVRCLRLPFPDRCVPTRQGMRAILDTIDAAIAAGSPTYVHCWGGRGRTGTVVGCWLARHGMASGDEVLRLIRHLRRHEPTSHQPSPENRMQARLVLSWHEGE